MGSLLRINKSRNNICKLEVMEQAKKICILIIKVNKLVTFSLQNFLKEIEIIFSVFQLSFSINLIVFDHKCCFLIGYATYYLFCDR